MFCHDTNNYAQQMILKSSDPNTLHTMKLLPLVGSKPKTKSLGKFRYILLSIIPTTNSNLTKQQTKECKLKSLSVFP